MQSPLLDFGYLNEPYIAKAVLKQDRLVQYARRENCHSVTVIALALQDAGEESHACSR